MKRLKPIVLGVRHLAAAGLLGFVLGAFVVGSLGHVSASRVLPKPIAEAALRGGVDDPVNPVVETPAPTSGHSGVIPTGAPEAKELVISRFP